VTWGIIPAAGLGTRMQPLAFSKELLPVGTRLDHGVERPRAVCEYLVERMLLGGATKICFVIAPTKGDIIEYFGGGIGGVTFTYVVQHGAGGLCDALFRALPLIDPNEQVLVGLPDTVWFPVDALAHLPDDRLTFLCFPVADPEHFDAVVSGQDGRVQAIRVKQPGSTTPWVWGAFKLNGRILAELAALWATPGRADTYVGTLVTAWLARGGVAWASRTGEAYADVGTLTGWRDAQLLLARHSPDEAPRPYRAQVADAEVPRPTP
jgi:glucose-1-phosphate thymidylyltransferase